MPEINKIQFTGTIERLQRIGTKTGNPMAKWLLRVGSDRFGCAAFGNIAEAILGFEDGHKVSITGQGKINSWKTEDGTWRNDFQVTVWSLEIDGATTAFEKGTKPPQHAPRSAQMPHQHRPAPRPAERTTDEFAYRGGPF